MNFSTERIFNIDTKNFEGVCLDVFKFQYDKVNIYRRYCDLLKKNPGNVASYHSIPFIPISFFKSHEIVADNEEAQVTFESSGTTGLQTSRHFVMDAALYERSFTAGFKLFYGDPENYCILGLLPSYLERGNSSLVYMVNELIASSNYASSGFFLNNFDELNKVLKTNEAEKIPTILFGVTYALLDFAEAFPQPLINTTIIETGGMKGRKKEMTRTEVHEALKKNFQKKEIHSEYGMTELLSQAYSKNDGIFNCPPWMKILVRSEDDPLLIQNKNNPENSGLINIIDLANIYSCSFIATDDVGIVYKDGSFLVLGRSDNSDLRGCSLLTTL